MVGTYRTHLSVCVWVSWSLLVRGPMGAVRAEGHGLCSSPMDSFLLSCPSVVVTEALTLLMAVGRTDSCRNRLPADPLGSCPPSGRSTQCLFA